VVEALIKAGAQVDSVNAKCGVTELMWAAAQGHVGVVEALINAGAEVDTVNDTGSTALLIAARAGHVAVVEALINAGAEVDKVNRYGDTALMIAAIRGQVAVIEALIHYRAQVDSVNTKGSTPLMWAVRAGHADVVEALINAGAEVDKVNWYGDNVLMWATPAGHADVVEALIKKGGNVHQANRAGETVLSLASSEMLATIADVRASMSPSEETFRCAQQDIQNLPVMLALAVSSERPGEQRMVPWLLKSAAQAREQAGDCSVCQESFTDLVGNKAELRRTNKACPHLVCDICEQQRLRSAAEPDDRNYGILYEDEEGREQWGGSRVPINLARCAVCRAENGSEFKPTADQEQEFARLTQLFMEQECAATDADRHLAQAIQQSELEALQSSEDARAKVSNDGGGAAAQALQQPQLQPDADGFYD